MRTTVIERPDLGRWEHRPKYAGGDLGLTRDSSTLAIVGAEEDRLALLKLVEYRPDRGQPLKLSEVIGGFATTLREFGISSFMADGWSREAAREHARACGVEILSAPEGRAGKTATHLATRDAMREQKLTLINDNRLRAQLRAIRSEAVAGGGLVISSPRRGGHGDLVSGLVLAVWQAVESINNVFEYDERWDEYLPKMRV